MIIALNYTMKIINKIGKNKDIDGTVLGDMYCIPDVSGEVWR